MDVSQHQKSVCFTLAQFEPEAVSAVCAMPQLKKRAFLGASGDRPVLTVHLAQGEDPLQLAAAVVERYALQVRWYAHALALITRIPVKEAYLFGLRAGESWPISLEEPVEIEGN